MTRLSIIIITIVALLLSSAAFYYANQAVYSDDGVKSYDARKEDVLLTQQKLENEIYALNQTVQMELENQKLLTEKITELAAKADLPPPVINTTKTVQADPVVVTVPKPRPTTRAS
ncbi:MAG: hypothetical protein ACP5N3_00125 [Candidatus Nanoarchaeia archaeon]